MKQYQLLIITLFFIGAARPQPAKVIAECTITFSISTEKGTGDATKTLYIKGRKTRSDIISPAFRQTTIFDNNSGEAVIWKEMGGDKYVTTLNPAKWKEKNAEWDGMTVKITNENKTIAGYNCRKAIATTTQGKNFILFYTSGITASASENTYQFKNIPGLVLEYESQNAEGKNISFKAVKVNLSPVPAAKFLLSKSGYKELENN